MNALNAGESQYDFTNEENSPKWKGVLTAALKKVLDQVHPSLGAQDDALEYVEDLCLRLLGMLCAKPSPHTVQDIEHRVQSTFPTPIDKWALKEAQDALERGKRKSVLLLPVDKIHSLLQKELLLYKVDTTVSLFLVAVLEYISADILKLAGNYVKNIKHYVITYQDVQISMNADKALMDMFYQDEGGGTSLIPSEPLLVQSAPRTSLTYEEVVRELIASEKAYMKELHMLIKVFREGIAKLTSDSIELECIFSNILDIHELTYTLLGSLEDVVEMSQDEMSYIGSCFEELAEAAEFDVYIRYAREVTSPLCRETLDNLLAREDKTRALLAMGHGMRLAMQYYLPALLMGPIRHCFSYLEYVMLLRRLSVAPEVRETLTQVEGLLKPLQMELSRCLPSPAVLRTSTTPFLQVRARRQAALDKLHEIEKNVEGWDPKEGQCCNEFIKEDVLMKVGSGKRLTERRLFLFDGLGVLCKPNSRRQSSVHQSHPEYRLKEHFYIRRADIVDHTDTDELKHAFEIAPRQESPIILCCKSAEEKNAWMADLVMLHTRPMLERILDSILSDIERKHPLKLPSPSIYIFAEPDSNDNIILEQRENGGVPLIKGATLHKLVERVTYHIYADPKFVRTFLTTYRSFCSPKELLDLLISRFRIPDPSVVYEQDCCDTDKIQKNSQREDWKKYRKEFLQPVQFRVLNVLRHWIEHHFYDFEREPSLLETLREFLDETVNGMKNMRKWVDSVVKIIQRKLENDTQRHIKFAFDELPPPIEWHLTCSEEEYGVLTLHPIEIARQLTVLEFDLYRMIKPSELVGVVWTKKDKEKTSPNLLKMIKHTTNVTRWLEKNIVEAENYEERVAIYNRICEILIVLNEMNNFNGVLSIVSACHSAAVHRLKHTYQGLTAQNKKALEESRADDHFKKYQEKLRSINPPCVPFVGMYLTNILHIEEGNPDFLPNTQLINFFKRRKVAEITGEIQQYQNQPYCFSVEPKIRHFLENLSPFGDWSDTEISNYLFNKSSEIEPRHCKQAPKFPRKWPNLSLKSPGIKTKSASKQIATAVNNAISSTLNSSNIRSEQAESARNAEEASAPAAGPGGASTARSSDNEFSVFASVQLGTGQNSPTLSPVSPAASNSILSWFQPNHSRSPSVSSIMSTTSFRNPPPPPVAAPAPHLQRYSHHSQSSTGGSNSPGPHSPASPGPHPLSYEPNSPRLSTTPPPPPPPLPPRRRRDSPEISSPQQKHPEPMDVSSPPPLPPRREPGSSPSAHSLHSHHSYNSISLSSQPTFSTFQPNHNSMTMPPQLNPTHMSQLHIRRHSAVQPQVPRRTTSHHASHHTNGGTIVPSNQPPSISPRYDTGVVTPRLPPRQPAARSADMVTGPMFQYPSTTGT